MNKIKTTITLLIASVFNYTFAENIETVTLAGGCFWCTEADMEKFLKDTDVISGYSGGEKKNPNYKEVASGKTKHIESIQFSYDKDKYSYIDILDNFLRHIDPTDGEGSFYDRGYQYSPAIFYHNEEQKKMAEDFISEVNKSYLFKNELNIKILKYKSFYDAEDYHQDYYKKSSVKYSYYRFRSGRDNYIENLFGDNNKTLQSLINYENLNANVYFKPSDDIIKKKLTTIQYKVTQKDATERAFNNEYWDNKEEGIYVDVVSGEPLFSSRDKYKSGTGWPSFTKPINNKYIIEKEDRSLFATRIEVRSRYGDSHLGHVFEDGPAPTKLRYCMNSAAMKFISKKDMSTEGYGDFLSEL